MSTVLEGVRTRHLRIDTVTFPHRAFTVIVGPSGAGKSTLLLDTLHAESRRRLEELVAVDKQRLVAAVLRPPIDRATGLLPTLAHAREAPGFARARTLASITSVDDALALLAVRTGILTCPRCDVPMAMRTSDEHADELLHVPDGRRVTVLAPLGSVDDARRALLLAEGWVRVRSGGQLRALDDLSSGALADLVVDRIAIRQGVRGRVIDAIELAWRLGGGMALVASEQGAEERISVDARCTICMTSVPRTTPEDLVWSSPRSRCGGCSGLGVVPCLDESRAVDSAKSLDGGAIRAWGPPSSNAAKPLLAALAKAHDLSATLALDAQDPSRVKKALGALSAAPSDGVVTVLHELLTRDTEGGDSDLPRPSPFLTNAACPACDGTGRSWAFRAHGLSGVRLSDLEAMTLSDFACALFSLAAPPAAGSRFAPVWRELELRVRTAERLGLGHLSLRRRGDTLSRGELQRARLVSQIGAPLESVMHLLDEPTGGLHPLDAQAVLDAIQGIVREGGTVVAIAHDPVTIRGADHAIVLGPGAGKHGGLLLASGNPMQVASVAVYTERPRSPLRGPAWTLRSCTMNHLAGMDVHIPEGALVTFTGVSGSGKSTLLRDGLAVAAEARRFSFDAPPGHGVLDGRAPSSVLLVDDRPLARSARSTVASAIGVFDFIREAYAATAEARARGYTLGRFSPNVRGGRCERCEGTGLEPGALDRFDASPCIACSGSRFNRETSEVRLHGHGIGELLALSVVDAAELLRGNSRISPRLDALTTLGLGYLPLGQTTGTLSSGEAKRVVLARALARADMDGALVLLDEPTAGLSADDVERFLDATEQLRARGATVVVAEHRPAVIAASDWIVELGPGPGARGGQVVVEGSLEVVLASETSVTRKALVSSRAPS
jgi:excinuclease ABC subunit A